MREREAMQNALAFCGETEQNSAGVLGAELPCQQTQGLQAIHQSDGAVMLEQQAIRKMTDGWQTTLRHPFQGQQGLMLLGLQAGIASRRLTEIEKAPDLKAELF